MRCAFCGRPRAPFWPSVTFIYLHFAVCQAPASSATAVTNEDVSAPHVDSSEANSGQTQPSASDSRDDDDMPGLVYSDDDDDNDFVQVSSDQFDSESDSDPSWGLSSLAFIVEVGSSLLCSSCCGMLSAGGSTCQMTSGIVRRTARVHESFQPFQCFNAFNDPLKTGRYCDNTPSCPNSLDQHCYRRVLLGSV